MHSVSCSDQVPHINFLYTYWCTLSPAQSRYHILTFYILTDTLCLLSRPGAVFTADAEAGAPQLVSRLTPQTTGRVKHVLTLVVHEVAVLRDAQHRALQHWKTVDIKMIGNKCHNYNSLWEAELLRVLTGSRLCAAFLNATIKRYGFAPLLVESSFLMFSTVLLCKILLLTL